MKRIEKRELVEKMLREKPVSHKELAEAAGLGLSSIYKIIKNELSLKFKVVATKEEGIKKYLIQG